MSIRTGKVYSSRKQLAGSHSYCSELVIGFPLAILSILVATTLTNTDPVPVFLCCYGSSTHFVVLCLFHPLSNLTPHVPLHTYWGPAYLLGPSVRHESIHAWLLCLSCNR